MRLTISNSGKSGEVCNIVLPFQTIEQVDELRTQKPEQQARLSPEQIRLLTAWLSGDKEIAPIHHIQPGN